MTVVRPGPPPFRSLDFFTSADAAVFAGREEEIEEVATRILAGGTLVVYGRSGVGKTSLLCAGVVPALEHRRGYRVTYVRPLQSPRDDVWRAVGAEPGEPLAAALARESSGSASADDAATDPGAGQGAAARAPYVLVLDQLEELFTRFDEAQRRPLWDGLVEVIEDPRAPLRLVLSVREEYLHLLDSAHPRLPNLLDRRFRLRGLTPFGARTAIVRPLVAGRIRYEPELVDRCVAELTEVPAGHAEEDGVVDPLLLQLVCSEVYGFAEQRAPEAPALTVGDYEALGGPAGVFPRHLAELFARVDAGDHLLLKLVLHEMTTAHATKLPTTIARLAQAGLVVPEAVLQRLLDQLVAAHLARAYEAEPAPWYELVHDRLVQALPDHFAHDQQFLRLRFMREVVHQLSRGFSEGMIGAPLLNLQQLADLVEPFRPYVRFTEQELGLLFRSAVATDHNVRTWHAAFEAAVPDGTLAIVLDMLGHTVTRRGAVALVGALGLTEPAIRARCLHLALHDSENAVVSAAARCLTNVAGTEQVAAIAGALGDPAARPRALWVLEELTEHPAVQAAVPARDLRRARHARDRRRIERAAEAIDRGGWEGLRIGLASGALAGLVAIAFWCVAVMWVGSADLWVYAAGAVAIAIGSAVLGMVCGHAIGRAKARLVALDREVTWIETLRDPRALATFAGGFAVAGGLAAFIVVAAAERLALPTPRFSVGLLLGLAALGPIALANPLYAVGLTERNLRLARWHRTRTRARIAISVGSLSWLFSGSIGAILVTLGGDLNKHVNEIIVATALGGAWCSVCATVIAAVLAETLWRHTRRVARRAWLVPQPALALFAIVIVLLWQEPLPPWAPAVDVTDGSHQVPSRVRLDHPTSWTYGHWLRIRNGARSPRIVSFSRHFPTPYAVLLIWPGGATPWLDRDVTEVSPTHRLIDLARETPSPGTYAVVPLVNAEWKTWITTVPLVANPSVGISTRVGCGVTLRGGDTETLCASGDALLMNCHQSARAQAELLPADPPSLCNEVAPRDQASQHQAAFLRCKPFLRVSCSLDSSEEVQRVDAVVLFDAVTRPPDARAP